MKYDWIRPCMYWLVFIGDVGYGVGYVLVFDTILPVE